MKFRRGPGTLDKIEMQMTPMIDIVFQLNIFFLLSFKIIMPEGDFNVTITSPAAAQTVKHPETLPISIVLKATPDGGLADVRVDSRSLGTGPAAFARLRAYVREHVQQPGAVASEQEAELDCDYGLHYQHVVAAMDAVTGYIENNQPHKLIEKIKFTPAKK